MLMSTQYGNSIRLELEAGGVAFRGRGCRRSEADETATAPGARELGSPLPEAGFSLLELMIIILIIGLIAALAIPQLTQSRKSGNEVSAIGSLRAIKTSQERHRQLYGRFGSMPELIATDMLDESFTTPRSGYVFATPSPPSSSGFSVTAEPENPQAGDRYFFLDASGVIRFSTAGTADATSRPIE